MHVAFGVVRDVVVQHVADALHVQATGGHVGSHQDVQLAFLQHGDGALTLGLLHVAVDGGSGQATGLQLAGQFLGAGLGAGEDDHRVERLDFQDAGQRVQLVHAAHPPVTLADVGRGGGLGLDGDFDRILQVGLGDATDLRRHGGREQGHLALLRQLLQHGFDVVDEAHAQHFIGFVQHQGLQLGQVQGAAVQVVNDAAGGTDHDVHATAQGRQLLAVGLAAVYRQHAEAGDLRRIGLEGLGDLDGQLAGRRQDQGLGLDLLQVDVGQYRQGEGRRLAGTGLRLAQHVAAFQHRRDGGGLDRRRGFIADGADGLHDGLGQAELRELQRRLGILGHGELQRHGHLHGSAIKKGMVGALGALLIACPGAARSEEISLTQSGMIPHSP